MGVSSTANRVGYTGNGATTSFAFPYYFFNLIDLVVYLYDTVTGTATLQVVVTNYTITATPNSQGVYPSGGSIVFGIAPTATQIISIFRNPTQNQIYSLGQFGSISSTALVQQLDYLTLLCQRLEDKVSRAVMIPDGMGATFNNNLPASMALPVNYTNPLIINAAGNGFDLGLSASGSVAAAAASATAAASSATAAANTAAAIGWQKVSFSYASLQTAATTNTITAFSLPALNTLNGLLVKHTTAFSGGSISAIQAQLGIAADHGKFIDNFDAFQGVADTAFESVMTQYLSSFTSPANITLTLNSTGANLSALTAGSIDIYYRIMLL